MYSLAQIGQTIVQHKSELRAAVPLDFSETITQNPITGLALDDFDNHTGSGWTRKYTATRVNLNTNHPDKPSKLERWRDHTWVQYVNSIFILPHFQFMSSLHISFIIFNRPLSRRSHGRRTMSTSSAVIVLSDRLRDFQFLHCILISIRLDRI